MRRLHPNNRLEETLCSQATAETVMPCWVVSSTSRIFFAAL
jgi:hypothetical protein